MRSQIMPKPFSEQLNSLRPCSVWSHLMFWRETNVGPKFTFYFKDIILNSSRAISPNFIILLLGLFLTSIAIVTPPFQGPDESNHFYRAYQISEFSFLPEKKNTGLGYAIPQDVIHSVNDLQAGIPFNPSAKFSINILRSELTKNSPSSQRLFHSFPNTALYSPVA